MTLQDSFPRIDDQDLNSISTRLFCLNDQIDNKTILITGGTGFLGKWLVESLLHLCETNNLNTKMLILSRNPVFFVNQLPHLNRTNRIELVKGDVRDFFLKHKKIDFIIHGATSPNLNKYVNQEKEMADIIISGTKRILETATATDTERILYISTGNVYGAIQNSSVCISEIPDTILMKQADNFIPDCYSRNKLIAEILCNEYAIKHGITIPIARVFHQTGAYIPLNSGNALGDFLNCILAKKPILLKSNGAAFRSYMYGTDFCVWMYNILTRGISQPYNVGNNEPIQLIELAKDLSQKYQLPLTIKGDIDSSRNIYFIPDINRAKFELGLTLEVSQNTAIDKTINWYRNAIDR